MKKKRKGPGGILCITMDSATLRKLNRAYPNTRSASATRDVYDRCVCCLETYQDVEPVCLPRCDHHICAECVQKLAYARCPLCRAVFPQYEYIRVFDTDTAVITLHELTAKCGSSYANLVDFANVFEYLCGHGYVLLLVNENFTQITKNKLLESAPFWDKSAMFMDILFNH